MGIRVPKPGARLFAFLLLGVALAAAVPSAFAQSPGNSNITGLPPEALERLPGAAKLFEVRNASAPPRILDHPFRAGEIVARFPLELGDGQIDQLARSLGAHGVERASPLGLFLVRGPQSVQGMERLMERLWESGEAVEIAANYLGELTFVPDDPRTGSQWHLEALFDIDLDMESAWDITRGSEDVVVAVIDTGIVEHPEFAGRLFVNLGEIPDNDIDDDSNGYVDDVSGWNAFARNGNIIEEVEEDVSHGTWVSSILLANGDNGHQVAGIDHFAKLLPVKFADQGDAGTLQLAAALDYLIANPQMSRIVNMSLAGFDTPIVENALSALAQTAILIGGSGNGGLDGGADFGLPESHPAVITVAGTDYLDRRAVFSDSGTSVDVAAPAAAIYSASSNLPNDPNAAHVGDGTSFAAPMVTGVGSLGLSIRPSMSRSDLLTALCASAKDLGPQGRDTTFGCGRVNAHGALLALQAMLFTDDFETGDLTAWSSSTP